MKHEPVEQRQSDHEQQKVAQESIRGIVAGVSDEVEQRTKTDSDPQQRLAEDGRLRRLVIILRMAHEIYGKDRIHDIRHQQ